MSDADLRDKIAETLMDLDSSLVPDDAISPTIDALMPVVREALAQAWDEGAEAAYEWQIGVIGKPDNPWRQEQP